MRCDRADGKIVSRQGQRHRRGVFGLVFGFRSHPVRPTGGFFRRIFTGNPATETGGNFALRSPAISLSGNLCRPSLTSIMLASDVSTGDIGDQLDRRNP